MSKGPIQFKPGVVRPMRPLDQEKREVFMEVGRAVVHVSTIEKLLLDLAWLVSPNGGDPYGGPAADDDWKLPELFFDTYGFEKRLQLVDLIMYWHARPEYQKAWNAITSTVRQHKAIRNLVAHLPLETVGLEGVQVHLHPHDLHPKHYGKQRKALRITEIRTAASALEKIIGDLEALCGEISIEKLNEDTE
jgi:hypothetical protein